MDATLAGHVDAIVFAPLNKHAMKLGGLTHEEYWIPAEELDAFNKAIIGKIEVIGRYTEADRLAHEQAAHA